jgi:hypothetical protein
MRTAGLRGGNYAFPRVSRAAALPDGVACGHAGCLNHVTHPCEGCGRIAGKMHKGNSNDSGLLGGWGNESRCEEHHDTDRPERN